jgi:putative colanic acid biosynthesis UDP-glucose lipid carrier transferase
MRTGLLKTHSTTIALLTRVLDVLLVLLGGVGAYYLRFGFDAGGMPLGYAVLMLIGGLLTAVVFPWLNVYNSWRARGLLAPAARAFAAWCLVLLGLLALLVLAKQGQDFSRLWMGVWAAIVAVMLIGLRIAVFAALRSLRQRGYNRRSAVVVGSGPAARNLIAQAREAAWAGFNVVAVFDDSCEESDVAEDFDVLPLAGFADFVEAERVDEVWIAVPLEQGGRLRGVLEALRYSTANVRYVPDLFGLFLLNHGLTEILGNPMIDLSASPMQGFNRVVKGLEDRVLSVLILLTISPLMLAIALGVKRSSPGPVFFRQRRNGWDGREIEVWKFRTMQVHREDDGVTQARRDDPRVTRFGAFLRRTSLDELPQFINVLQGHMSIVGPRPHAVEHNEEFKGLVDHYMQRHKVKPGITGWAQINGWRGETDTVDKMKRRIEHDLYYIENWSLGFDLKIIFLTLFRGFVHKNAY